jgi:S1-C subfamily serine protease
VYHVTFRQLVLVAVIAAVASAAGVVALLRVVDGTGAEGAPGVGALERSALAQRGPDSDEQNNIDVYRAISPGVVNITTTAYVQTFFGVYPQRGSGSGSIMDQEGRILTNYHVVAEGAQARGQQASIEVALADKSTYPATIVGADPDHDLAVLKIEAPAAKLTPVPLGDSAGLLVGQKVLAIGNPFGLQQTLTTGVISALERPLKSPSGQQIAGVIQTDAAINPGNSGGPLLNSRGEMIGINTAIFSESGGNVGIGFAVPVNTAKRIIPDLIRYGRAARPYLGASFLPVDQRVARILGIRADLHGLVVYGVSPGSPAARAGIRGLQGDEGNYSVGDIIVGIDGQDVTSQEDLQRILNAKRPGDNVRLDVLRGVRRVPVQLVLSSAPTQRAPRD